MEKRYLAKSKPIKTIQEHTQDLLNQYAILQTLYPNILDTKEWELLKKAVIYHDLGKMNTKFQNKLYKKCKIEPLLEDRMPEEEEVPHNMLSTYFLPMAELKEKYTQEELTILASSIYYHHDRNIKEYSVEKIVEDLKKQVQNFGDFLGEHIQNIRPISRRYILDNKKTEDIRLLESNQYIKIKGLLNKLDYVASMNKQGVNVEESTEGHQETISNLIEKKIEIDFKGSYRPVQKYMKEHKEDNLVVISPTGSGKTEAALLWGGNEKLFYTLPLKVSINAMHERILKLKYSKVVLLHSGAYNYYLENQSLGVLNAYDRAKRLSAPLIVTTVDQLFKIAFRYQGYEEILATLSYSRVIIDEIQMYTPELLAYILLGLAMLTKIGGKFAIITATFPPILYHFMEKLKIPFVTAPKAFEAPIKNRHKISMVNQTIDISLIKQYALHSKVLVIANTVSKAQELYEQLQSKHTYLLHSQFLRADRQKLEEKILKFTNRNGIWISTQIVEASLDVDFDVLFTEMCSIDSLFQRMGRVYRSREYQKEEPNVYIYDTRNGVPKIINTCIYEWSLEQIQKKQGQMLTEEDKQEMICAIFDLEKNKELKSSFYYKEIERILNMLQTATPNEIERKDMAKLFRDINSVLLIPENVYEKLEQEGKIEEWNSILRSDAELWQKLMVKNEISKYTISVMYTNKLEFDEEELFYKNSNIHRTRYEYEFDSKTLQGKGLIKQIKPNSNFDE